MPANAQEFFGFIVSISNFNIIPTDKITKLIFKFNQEESFNQAFKDLDIF